MDQRERLPWGMMLLGGILAGVLALHASPGPGLPVVVLAAVVVGLAWRLRQLEQRMERLKRDLQRSVIPSPSLPETPSLDWEADFTFEPVATPSAAPSPFDRTWTWLVGGNPVLRIGMLVVFVGVSFLLKYAAEHSLVPPELRLAAATGGGVALLALGWRLRQRQPAYALVLQGGGIGVLYLCVFAATRLLALLPTGAAFPLLLLLVMLSAVLALRQQSQALACFGAAGGFLAPVLLSTGGGSHVALFGYYALLNLGILLLALRGAWRWLNLLGAFFTFGIGAVWGWRFYQPAYFATTEPFLVFFFLLYVTVAVLFARRRQLEKLAAVDSGLVFGVPLAVFILQQGLVEGFAHGMAWSAGVLGGFYLLLALWRFRRGMDLLGWCFFALGVGFASVTVPLALDGRWTASTWALEGAAMVWLGLRQQRWLSRNAGLLLQMLAGLSYLASVELPTGSWPVANGACLGGLLLSLAGLLSAIWYFRQGAGLRPWEKWHGPLAALWGLIWWYLVGTREILHQAPAWYEPALLLGFIALSGALALILTRREGCGFLIWPPLLLPLAMAAALLQALDTGAAHPSRDGGALAWLLAGGAWLLCLQRLGRRWPRQLSQAMLLTGSGLLLILLTWEADWLLRQPSLTAEGWDWLAWGMVPALATALLLRTADSDLWPFSEWRVELVGYLAGGALLWQLLWTLGICFSAADPKPLPYLPLFNPLELTQAALLPLLLWWGRRPESPLDEPLRHVLPALAGLVGLVLLSTFAARCVHVWVGVPYTAHALWHSFTLQATLSLLWGLLALAAMARACRRQRRDLWFGGGALLGLELLKLLLVDLSGRGTVARIVSFLGVGVLMLVIGWFAPLPPASVRSGGLDGS